MRLTVGLSMLVSVGLVPGDVVGAGAGTLAPKLRLCFAVAGSPGDVAVVNLTPVGASGAGNAQLISSDVGTAPNASNVNFAPGTVDPNVAVAPIGSDGRVCFQNSVHANAHVIADHLGTIRASGYVRHRHRAHRPERSTPAAVSAVGVWQRTRSGASPWRAHRATSRW
jgi:hypothetical protein